MSARKQPAKSEADLRELADLLGHTFGQPSLLETAVTHRSRVAEAGEDLPQIHDNEQLEFVGDAVLGLVVADALFRLFPHLTEGELTRMRAMLVSRSYLGEVASAVGLGRFLRLGRGEEQSGGRNKSALLSNALEAVIAALYLDGGETEGLVLARRFVDKHVVHPRLETLRQATGEGVRFGGAVGDYKSALQELLQSRGAGQPKYTVVQETGPDHRKHFRMQVQVKGEAVGEAEGRTKKEAQQAAARLAYERLLASDV